MNNIKKHIDLLGFKVKDKVTGFKGVVVALSFDLYGCIQATVNPGQGNDGNLLESHWFDVNRLKVTSEKPVMDVPDFDHGTVAEGKKGAAQKPMKMKS